MSFEYEKITVLEEFIGKTSSKIEVGKWKDELSFHIEDKVYKFIHYQECCEDVSIEDICGNLEDLINEPILMAEEYFSRANNGIYTFYKFATRKGYVTVRWYGTSNGYYSVSASFIIEDSNGNILLEREPKI